MTCLAPNRIKLFILLLALLGLATGRALAQDNLDAQRQLFNQKCSPCHSPNLVYKDARTRAGWELLLKSKQRMTEGKGEMEISDSQAGAIVDYLTDYVNLEIKATRKSRTRLFFAATGVFFALMAFVIYLSVRQQRAKEQKGV